MITMEHVDGKSVRHVDVAFVRDRLGSRGGLVQRQESKNGILNSCSLQVCTFETPEEYKMHSASVYFSCL